MAESVSGHLLDELKKQMKNGAESLATMEELMAHLNLSKPTIYQLMKDGVIVPYRLGKSLRFKLSEVDKALESTKQKGGKS